MGLVSIRGAITVLNNNREEILEATEIVLKEILESNLIKI